MRIVICDDHPVVVMGVKSVLASQGAACRVVGEANGGESLLKLLAATPCDLLITDFSMPGDSHRDDGLPLLRRLRKSHPDLPVIVLTMIRNPALMNAMLSFGIRGVVDKTGMMSELLLAVHAVSNGRSYMSARVGASAAGAQDVLAVARTKNPSVAGALSVREAEVVRLYTQGLSVTEIAEAIHRSVKTVSKQKNDAMRKLGLESNRELYEFARIHGLLS